MEYKQTQILKKTKVKKKIIITGGHLTPAIATIEELKRQHPAWEVVWIGRKVALEGTREVSEEYRLVTGMGIRFLPLTTGRLQRALSRHTIPSLIKVPLGFLQALWYLVREKPDAIVSFGGYVALPVVLMAWLLRIPTLTHEQTRRPGLANRIIGRFSRRICVSFPNQLVQFPQGRAVYTGLPLRKVISSPPANPPPIPVDAHYPILFITGGSTGAASLNDIVFATLPRLLADYTVIHQVGRLSQGEGAMVAARLTKDQRSRYVAVPYLDSDEYSWVLHHADLIIGRSGANTVFEIATIGNIGLFVPLPWAGGNEQLANAKFLMDAGSARVIHQKDLTPEVLVGNIHEMLKNKADYLSCAKSLSRTISQDGAERIVAEVMRLIMMD